MSSGPGPGETEPRLRDETSSLGPLGAAKPEGQAEKQKKSERLKRPNAKKRLKTPKTLNRPKPQTGRKPPERTGSAALGGSVRLKVEAALPGALGEGLHPAVVQKAVAVEDDVLDVLLF